MSDLNSRTLSKETDTTVSGYVIKMGLHFRGLYNIWKEGMSSVCYVTIF